MTIANTYKDCNIMRFDISADITPVNPLEDKFLIAITFHNNLINIDTAKISYQVIKLI